MNPGSKPSRYSKRGDVDSTPADSQRYRKAPENLVADKEITITSAKGGQRRKATTIEDDDIIEMAVQRTLSL